MRVRAFIAGAAAAVALFLAGHATAASADTAPKTDHVSTWNDGFADSKQDDCDMGFAPACSWLAETH
jgi:uncharacterized membrane protein